MNCYGDNIIYKGEDSIISIPFEVSGFSSFSASFYTNSDTKIERSIEDFVQSGGYLTIEFQDTDLDILPDGVLRYTFKYKIGSMDVIDSSNTVYVLKTPQSYSAITPEEIYMSGYTSGETAQKAKLVSTAITQNGTYTKENGYNSVSVNVPASSLQTKDVTLSQTAVTITPDTGYDGMSEVNVDAKGLYDIGYADAQAAMVATAITANGTYSRVEGYSSINVNVTTTQVVTLTQAQYNALTTKDNNTIYLIKN